MPYVHIIVGLALVEFLWFGFAVAKARGRYKVAAPAVTGNEIFERYLRVQMNTLEQLVVFIPSILLFSQYMSPYIAAALRVFFLIWRLAYFFTSVKDPKSRELGCGLTIGPNAILPGGAIGGGVRA